MNFIITIPLKQKWSVRIQESGRVSEPSAEDSAVLRLERSGHSRSKILRLEGRVFCIVGDFIIPEANRHDEEAFLQRFLSGFTTERLRETKGNFYLIIIDEQEQSLKVMSSMMSILPVYYASLKDTLILSSRADAIVQSNRDGFSVSRKYILEHLIFGYGFLNDTLFNEIKLLPANSAIELDNGKWRVSQHTLVKDLFDNTPKPWKDSVEEITDLFIERIADYFPEKKYYSSLTGGLDGRTVLAAGLARGKEITAYSYGAESDKDIYIPRDICRAINLPYRAFILDKDYAKQYFLDDARAANRITEGNLRFSRATYLLLAREISRESEFMLSGNFGSELFRTPRKPGNMIAQVVFAMYGTDSDSELADIFRNLPVLRYLEQELFKNELEELITECLEYRNSVLKTHSKIQGFYIYLFEEVFRKYFGPELILENQYITNRTPFLDFKFMERALRSELAGCNSEYVTENPFNRYKGQVVYPYIIKKTYPELLKYKLDREYSPADFLTAVGKLKIAYGFVLRKLFIDRGRYRQPGYNRLAMSTTIGILDPEEYDFGLINLKNFAPLFHNDGWSDDYISFNIMLSLFDYMKTISIENPNVRV